MNIHTIIVTWNQTDLTLECLAALERAGVALGDVWVVGTYSLGFNTYSERAHWDGQRWSTESFSDLYGTDFEPFFSLWGTGPRDVWLNGTWHFDGQQWSRMCRQTAQTGRVEPDVHEAGLHGVNIARLYMIDCRSLAVVGGCDPTAHNHELPAWQDYRFRLIVEMSGMALASKLPLVISVVPASRVKSALSMVTL